MANWRARAITVFFLSALPELSLTVSRCGCQRSKRHTGLHQQRPHPPVTHPVNGTDSPVSARTVFARTTAGIAADLFAIEEALPVAPLGVQGDERHFPQALGFGLIWMLWIYRSQAP